MRIEEFIMATDYQSQTSNWVNNWNVAVEVLNIQKDGWIPPYRQLLISSTEKSSEYTLSSKSKLG